MYREAIAYFIYSSHSNYHLTKGLVINYGEGGYKMGNLWVQNFLHPRPQPSRQKIPTHPLFVRVKLHLSPPPFCSPPLPITNVRSLRDQMLFLNRHDS